MSNSERINRMEDRSTDVHLAASALLESVTVHKRNFEVSQRNFEIMQRQFEATTTEIRELHAENCRILDIPQNRNTEGDSEG